VENVYIQNISKTNSVLVLRSQRQQSKNYNYTSGAINSQNKQFWKGPARVCVNAMLPGRPFSSNSNGVWPAHWLMPNTKACWPSNGEIDIMEMINGDGVLHGTYHWSPNCSNCNCTNLQLGGQTKITGDWNATWHEYAVEYTNDWIAFVLDSKVYSNITRGMKHKGVPAAFYDVPYYLILNTAVGGPWPKPVDASTTFPLYHYIDYVHVSKPK
jgi:beta-glucanase (GH16 family)